MISPTSSSHGRNHQQQQQQQQQRQHQQQQLQQQIGTQQVHRLQPVTPAEPISPSCAQGVVRLFGGGGASRSGGGDSNGATPVSTGGGHVVRGGYAGSPNGSFGAGVPQASTHTLPASNSPGGQTDLEASETRRRQVEWERQIESLDLKEMELHQTQLRIFRDQTTAFIRDLGALRQEVAALRNNPAEQMVGSFAERLDAVEAHQRRQTAEFEGLEALREAHQSHGNDLRELRQTLSQHQGIGDRLEVVEQVMKTSTDKHWQEIAALKSALQAQANTLPVGAAERLDFVEQLLGDTADKHAREVSDLRQAHERHLSDLFSLRDAQGAFEKRFGDLSDQHGQALANAQAAHDRHRLTLEERLEELERTLRGDSDEKHREFRNFQTTHASLPERVQYLEQMLGDSSDEHRRELQLLKDSHSKLFSSHGQHAQDIQALQGSLRERLDTLELIVKEEMQELRSGHSKTSSAHATLQERLDFLEKMMGDSADHHSKNFEALQAAHERSIKDLAALSTSHSPLPQRVAFLEQQLGESLDKHGKSSDHHASLEDRLNRLEVFVRDTHGKELQRLWDAHSDLVDKHGRHRELPERLAALEGLLGDTTKKHWIELEALREAHGSHKDGLDQHARETKAQHSQQMERLQFVEKLLGDSADQQAKDMENCMQSLNSTAERLAFLEQKVGDSVDRHASELSALRDAYTKGLHAHGASLEERVRFVENSLGESLEGHQEELKALKTQHDRHLADLAALRESHGQHASLPQRVDYLEQLFGDSADKHERAVKALQQSHDELHSAHGKHLKELDTLKALQSHHATINQRLDYLEKVVGDSSDKHFAELQDLKSLHSRHAEALTGHAKDVAKALSNHSSLAERVNQLERCQNDSSKQAERELDALKAAQSKCSKELVSCRTTSERLERLETRLRQCFAA